MMKFVAVLLLLAVAFVAEARKVSVKVLCGKSDISGCMSEQ